jgi:hypothetical protein
MGQPSRVALVDFQSVKIKQKAAVAGVAFCIICVRSVVDGPEARPAYPNAPPSPAIWGRNPHQPVAARVADIKRSAEADKGSAEAIKAARIEAAMKTMPAAIESWSEAPMHKTRSAAEASSESTAAETTAEAAATKAAAETAPTKAAAKTTTTAVKSATAAAAAAAETAAAVSAALRKGIAGDRRDG